jgi:preprotein translocase subunit SecA
LEYDDVLNSQRVTIYSQRDRIFTKEELDEDVNEMLTREVEARIAALAEDDEAAWKLLAWLEQIQPTQAIGNVFIPSFMYNLLLQDLEEKANDKANTKAALIEIAEGSLNAEENHVKDAALEILASNQDWLETQLEERLDVLEIFIEALGYADETETRGPKELFDEVQALVRVPLTMGRSEQRQLQENPDEALELLSKQVEQQLTQQAAIRVSGAVDRRLNAELGLNTKELAEMEWDVLAQTVNQAVDAYFNSQRESLLGKDKLDAELDTALNRIDGQDYHVGHLLQLLLGMQQGTQIGFNPRTKRREERRYVRFRYFFHAAELLGRVQEKDLQERVLSHLQRSLLEMKRGWGFVSMQQAGSTAIAMLPKKTRQKLEDRFGAEGWNNLKTKTLGQLDAQQDSEALALIGERELTEAHRAILLRAISEHWIEYLTKMEALRVSIGLEAYGQRDPLVQYKAQASQMFSQLIQDIRTQVVNRMFNLQPRAAQLAPAPSQSNGQSAASNAQDAAVTQPTKTEKPQPLKSSVADNKGSDKKKKRRRRR